MWTYYLQTITIYSKTNKCNKKNWILFANLMSSFIEIGGFLNSSICCYILFWLKYIKEIWPCTIVRRSILVTFSITAHIFLLLFTKTWQVIVSYPTLKPACKKPYQWPSCTVTLKSLVCLTGEMNLLLIALVIWKILLHWLRQSFQILKLNMQCFFLNHIY